MKPTGILVEIALFYGAVAIDLGLIFNNVFFHKCLVILTLDEGDTGQNSNT